MRQLEFTHELMVRECGGHTRAIHKRDHQPERKQHENAPAIFGAYPFLSSCPVKPTRLDESQPFVFIVVTEPCPLFVYRIPVSIIPYSVTED
jgi:hypothetical protein